MKSPQSKPVKIKLPFSQAWQNALFTVHNAYQRVWTLIINSLTLECYHAITKYPQAVSEASCDQLANAYSCIERHDT